MRLFTPATHRGQHCDAYVIDTARLVRPLALEAALPLDTVVDALLERVLLMSRSLYAVRNRTFALFAAERNGRFLVAPTEPFHTGVLGAFQDALRDFGRVETQPDEPAGEGDLFALLAYERGNVAFFDGPPTRAWVPLAGRRGLRILFPAPAHAPNEDVFVGDTPLADFLAAPEEITLDLEALGKLPDDEVERLLNDELKDWDQS